MAESAKIRKNAGKNIRSAEEPRLEKVKMRITPTIAGIKEVFTIVDLDANWRVLRLLNLYRTIVAGLLVILFLQRQITLFGSAHANLFLWVASFWLVSGVLASFTLKLRWPGINWQGYCAMLSDVAIIILLTHASGGQTSGLGVLLFVPAIAAATILSERVALLFAAIASISLLVEQGFSYLEDLTPPLFFANSGLQGIILFVTALVGSRVAQRFRESEALAQRRGVDLQNMAQVNDAIIRQTQFGILVVDQNERIRQINPSAAKLLHIHGRPGMRVSQLSPPLAYRLSEWRSNPELSIQSIAIQNRAVQLRFQRLGENGGGAAIVFLEDADKAAEQLQQSKLAALGRLTASIAHEIRNPIGAISHAGQLLAENPNLEGDDQRFVSIIEQQTARVNEIIENILQLGRKQAQRTEPLEVTTWLRDFVMEYCDSHRIDLDAIELETPSTDVLVRFDPSQLRQILANLVDNARLHAGMSEQGQVAIIRAETTSDGNLAALDVVDFGIGVSADIAEQIFEPFYTRAHSGTGLGLFIARELCECNHARLNYGKDGDGKSCFRIHFQTESAWLT